MFEEPTPKCDTDKGPRQTGPPEVKPVITVNEPDKVSRADRCVLFLCQVSLLHVVLFFLHQLKNSPSVNRSGRMNLFSLMQSISELDDEDKEHVRDAECNSPVHFHV